MRALPVAQGLWRALAFFAAWIILGRTGAADLAVGALAAVLAAGASLRLLPPGSGALNPPAALRFAGRFASRSVLAGLDVALRVCRPTVRARPGILHVPCPVPEGLPRQAFCAVASLQPGTLPLGGDAHHLTVHCLDVTAPVAADLAADAAAVCAVISRPIPSRPTPSHPMTGTPPRHG